jgi:hypothetical protein
MVGMDAGEGRVVWDAPFMGLAFGRGGVYVVHKSTAATP